MRIETQYSIGEKIEIGGYDKDDQICTIMSMEINVLKIDKMDVTYWYRRDKSNTEGRFTVVEDCNGNQIGFKYY